MNSKTLLLGGLSFSAMAALGLIACGDSSSSSGNPLEFGKDDLPACATKTDGSLLIVEGKLQQCMGKDTTWQEIICDKGKKLAASMQLADDEEYYNILCGSDTVGVLLNEVAESCKLEGKGTYKITCDGDSLGVITIKDAPKPVEESSSSVAEDEDDNDDNEDDVTEESSSSSSKKRSSSSSAEESGSGDSGKSSSSKGESSEVSSSSEGESAQCTDNTETQTCIDGELVDNENVGTCGEVKYDKNKKSCTYNKKVIPLENAGSCEISHEVEGNKTVIFDKTVYACVDKGLAPHENVGTCGITETPYNKAFNVCTVDGKVMSNTVAKLCEFTNDRNALDQLYYDENTFFCVNTGDVQGPFVLCDGKTYTPRMNLGKPTGECKDGNFYYSVTGKNETLHFFEDLRDHHVYEYKTLKFTGIDEKTWMVSDLAYTGSGRKGINDSSRLYKWEEAKDACPAGWRVPENTDYLDLLQLVDSDVKDDGNGAYSSIFAARYFKSTQGWTGNQENAFGLNLTPTGLASSADATITNISEGRWWTSTKVVGKEDRIVLVLKNNSEAVALTGLVSNYYFALRCVKEN